MYRTTLIAAFFSAILQVYVYVQ